jgi:hypothetical protein
MHNYIIEDGFNTSYIDSLLMALFYTPSIIEKIFLIDNPKKTDNIYLQEIIKNKFLEPIRDGKSILSDTINEMRNNIFIYGWLDYDTICDNQDVINFYTFISELLISPIKIQYNKYNEDTYYIDITKIINNNEMIINNIDNNEMISIKDCYNNWLDNEIRIINIPPILPFYINRNNNKIKINIQKRIKLDPTDNSYSLDWIFHSAICLKDCHYYTLMQNCGKWFLYDNQFIPCIKEIKMNDKEIINMIMEEVVIVFYIYNQ